MTQRKHDQCLNFQILFDNHLSKMQFASKNETLENDCVIVFILFVIDK